MRKVTVTIALLSMVLNLMPVLTYADTTDECDRVGSLIDNVQALINRAGPIILRSGNREAIALLNDAISHLAAARRAYNNDLCRTAFNHAQTAGNLIRRALRLINQTDSY